MSQLPKKYEDWIEKSNENALTLLCEQGKTKLGITPFIGAGFSLRYGFKNWTNVLLEGAPPNIFEDVKKWLDKNEYEEAAELLREELGNDGFQNLVALSAGDHKIEQTDFREGAIALLPLITKGIVVTTNFDRVLEKGFAQNNSAFESVISGPRPDLIVDALHSNKKTLIKLHGDWQDRVGRTFSKSDYESNYGVEDTDCNSKKRELLISSEELIFSSRSLLFIGASLNADRTVDVLKNIHEKYAGIRHFAILNVPMNNYQFDEIKFNEVNKRIKTYGVIPIWYEATSATLHNLKVERLLKKIVEELSTRTISRPTATKPTVNENNKKGPDESVRHEEPEGLDAHLSRITRLAQTGKLVFFLGSAIHAPTKLMAKTFYSELAQKFECEALAKDNFAIAQYINDRYGKEELNAEIQKQLKNADLNPRETHKLFCAWDQFRSHDNKPIPYPTIITTNYDCVLEKALDDAGQPYHLFSYQCSGINKGKFYYRKKVKKLTISIKSLQLIEVPENIKSLDDDGFVIVKLNGGLDFYNEIPENFVTARIDYWDLAARLPLVLPHIIKEKLLNNPLLFLGSGLMAPDIEALIRLAHTNHFGPRSWAIVKKEDDIEYWRQCGIEILNYKIADYVPLLYQRLLGKPEID